MRQQRITKEQAQEIYKDLGYLSQPFPYGSASFLEVYGRLLGLSPASSKTANVLEIGSAYGGNLLSQAMFYPKATFTGIELAPTQVTVGNTYIQELGLKNVQLLEGDINDSLNYLGTYDYIIAHGFYSWVDDTTKDNFLRLCKNHLAPHGILYVSYNTYPGWHTMDAVRGLLLFANQDIDTFNHRERVRHGKTVASKVGAHILEYDDLKARHNKFLGALRHTLQQQDCYVGHDHLEPTNTPVYFHQFIDHIKSHGFQYLCDSDLPLSFAAVYDESLRQRLQDLAPHDPLAQEQYIDFIGDTSFRKSLLTHSGTAVPRLTHETALSESFQQRLEQFLLTSVIDSAQFETLIQTTLDAIEDKEVKNSLETVLQYLVQDGPYFYLKDATIHTPRSSLSIPEKANNAFYQFILHHIIQSGLQLTMLQSDAPYKHHVFEENASYVPQRYIPFVEIMLREGINSFIYPGNRYNEPISDFNEEDLEFMKLLTAPTTKHQVMLKVYEAMTGDATTETDLLQSNQYHMIEAFFDEMIHRMEYFGFLEL